MMTHSRDKTPTPHPAASGASPPAPPPAEEIILRVPMRPALVAQMRAFAAREGASVEALAALWLEEKLDEARRHLPGGGSPASLAARDPGGNE
jgi:hypothetical protein